MPTEIPLFPAKRIWYKAPHNAFTDLAWFRGAWWCVFREGENHVSPDGQIRLLRSKNGESWRTVKVFVAEGADLRDPSLVVTPQNKLVLLSAKKVLRAEHGFSHLVYAWQSDTGRQWSQAQEVGEKDLWLWRVAFPDSNEQLTTGLGVAYKVGGDYHARLYSTENGIDFIPLVERLRGKRKPEYSNESGLCFSKDGTAWCLMRRDPQTALLGSAKPPYKRWNWKDTKQRIGGPVMATLDDGRILSVVRFYTVENKQIVAARTSFAWVNTETGKLTECGRLPSGGDTSYAGLVVKDGVAYVSYYSAHRLVARKYRPSIYFAQVPICDLLPDTEEG
ncbi:MULTISPECIES: exo-alpha-sialidase [Gammaproteobacteria]|uniref:exo-alpha-sialidase n=1 Tax=Gammaproteobacteria TaxID=1236 RepID=UPI001A9EF919|nr:MULTISPECIES: exo-alpha-sialidase [Gammaproteobacteria]